MGDDHSGTTAARQGRRMEWRAPSCVGARVCGNRRRTRTHLGTDHRRRPHVVECHRAGEGRHNVSVALVLRGAGPHASMRSTNSWYVPRWGTTSRIVPACGLATDTRRGSRRRVMCSPRTGPGSSICGIGQSPRRRSRCGRASKNGPSRAPAPWHGDFASRHDSPVRWRLLVSRPSSGTRPSCT